MLSPRLHNLARCLLAAVTCALALGAAPTP